MTKKFKIISLTIPCFLLLLLLLIIFNSPIYPGFESGLIYLSPDLAESRTLLRETFRVEKESVVKLVFEYKDRSLQYSRTQFNNFLDDLIVEIWNDDEYYKFDNEQVHFDINNGSVQLMIGLIEAGEFNIYIKSDLAVNQSFHIGVGIGYNNKISLPNRNYRSFY